MLVDFDVGGQQGMDFSQEEALLWIMDSMGILAGSNSLKLKHLNYGFISHKHEAFHFSRH